jgi:hypothetical protein
MPSILFWILPFALVAPIIGLQLVRERLVARLQARRAPEADSVSDWTFSAGLPGYATAIKREFVWGEASAVLLRNPDTRRLVILARLFSFLFWVFMLAAIVLVYFELAK